MGMRERRGERDGWMDGWDGWDGMHEYTRFSQRAKFANNNKNNPSRCGPGGKCLLLHLVSLKLCMYGCVCVGLSAIASVFHIEQYAR